MHDLPTQRTARRLAPHPHDKRLAGNWLIVAHRYLPLVPDITLYLLQAYTAVLLEVLLEVLDLAAGCLAEGDP